MRYVLASLGLTGLALCFCVAAVAPAGATAVYGFAGSPQSSPIIAGSGSLPSTFDLLERRPAPRRDPMRIWNRLTPDTRVRSHVAVDSRLFLFESDRGISTRQALQGISLVDSSSVNWSVERL